MGKPFKKRNNTTTCLAIKKHTKKGVAR